MKKNISGWDSTLRVITGLALVGLFASHYVQGIAGNILLALGGVGIITGYVNFCPVYSLFKISTAKAVKRNHC